MRKIFIEEVTSGLLFQILSAPMKNILLILFSLLTPFLLTHCQATLPQPESNPIQISSDGIKEAESSPVLSAGNNLPIHDVLEDGFCYDDIYATYLRQKYLAQAQKKLKRFRSARSRRHYRKKIENESYFAARRALVGPLYPYFGALPVVANPEVEFWLQYFKTRGRRTFIKWLSQAEKFRSIVEPILKEQGLPSEFFFLAMVESGFSNTAYSRAAATGTWQFMKSTARLYGLTINHWIDERRNPIKATYAASAYLKDLYEQFGDWYLAMAAYNAGPGKVRRAIRKARSRDFWALIKTPYLRAETKHYVPKVLAALVLSHEASKYGFKLNKDNIEPIIPQNTVKIFRPVYLKEIAAQLDISLATLRRWNPEIVGEITPPLKNKSYYELHLPQELSEKFNQIEYKLTHLDIKDFLIYRVKRGDTLSEIAQRYNVSLKKIRSINPKLNPRALRIGLKIAIPIPAVVQKKTTRHVQQDEA